VLILMFDIAASPAVTMGNRFLPSPKVERWFLDIAGTIGPF